MPLPQSDSRPWPPPPFDVADKAMLLWNAWYAGDTTTLRQIYTADGAAPVRPSQLAGGVVGAFSRFWWGKPNTNGINERGRLHVPIPADLATASADLLFSEPPRLVTQGATEDAGHKVEQKRLEELFNKPRVYSSLLEAAELASALGGAYLTLAWDEDIEDHPFLVTQDADTAVPEFRHGRLNSVRFATVVNETNEGRDGTTWRHLELHEMGRIEHGLYLGSRTSLGVRIPLQDRSETAWVAEQYGDDGIIETHIERLTAVYVPNAVPNRLWRREFGVRDLGRSDFDGCEQWFDAADEAWSSWMRDLRLAKARLLVPQSALTNFGPGKGAGFDTDQEIFTGLDVLGKPGDPGMITPAQFAIRVQEHRETIQEQTRIIARHVGLDSASLGDSPVAGNSMTATEVSDRDRLSQRTRDKKTNHWKPALAEIAAAMLDLDVAVFGSGGGRVISSGLPEVRFPAESQIDPEKVARTSQLLRNADAASTETLVRMNHPEWDGPTVNEEVQRIRDDKQASMPQPLQDPFTIGHDQGQNQGNNRQPGRNPQAKAGA